MTASKLCGSAAVALVSAAMAGCGGTTVVNKTVVETVAPTTPSATPAPTPSRPRPRSQAAAPLYRQCDANISAKASTTTCGFAENTFYEYWKSGESAALRVYSPKTEATFSTRCSAGVSRVVCRTSDRGVVRFSQAAVSAYSQSQADQYVSRHKVGPESEPAPSPTPQSSGSGGGSGCDPNYTGACVPDDGADYNCPDINGSNFNSVGSDPDGLDRDGDGIACDS